MNRSCCGWCLAVLVVAVAMNARAQALDDATPPPIEEDDRPAPVDWGYGPGVPPNNDMRAAQEMIAAPAAAPVGGPDAQTKGVFGPPVTWPIIAIYAVILPDGRVMNYGTNKQGQQGAELMYDVWDPKQGRGNGAHTVLPNTTNTDIFCGAQSVIPASGEVLITGGDKEIDGEQHFSDRQTSVFHPRTNKITTSAPMQYARWYPTLVGLPTGEMLVLGGRKDKVPETPARTPEAFTQNVGWRTLSGATSDAAFGAAKAWYYPRAFVAPNGKVFVLGKDGKMFYLDPAGRGTITQLRQQTLRSTYYAVPSVMFAPGRILSVRTEKKVIVVDLNDREPAITQTAGLSQVRIWASGTVLADGEGPGDRRICRSQPIDRRGVRGGDLESGDRPAGRSVPRPQSRVSIIRPPCCCLTRASSPPAAARRGR